MIICYLPPIKGNQETPWFRDSPSKLMPDAGFHAHLFFNVFTTEMPFRGVSWEPADLESCGRKSPGSGELGKEEEFWEVSKTWAKNWWFHSPLWIHPGRLTWNIIIGVWKIIFLSKWVICMFHVNLPGCRVSLVIDGLVSNVLMSTVVSPQFLGLFPSKWPFHGW